jgi:subtilisin family serine protease
MRLPLALIPPAVLLAAPAWAGPLEDFDANVARGLAYDDATVVVRMDDGTEDARVQALAARAGCAWDHRWGRRDWHTLHCQPAAPRSRLAWFAQQPGVAWVQVPFEAALTSLPDDLLDRQWHHRNTGQRIGGRNGTAGADIGTVDAWTETTGGPGAVVAVIDTGVFVGHDELAGRIARSAGEDCDNNVDDDGNGYVDDCWGWDPADNDNDPDPRVLPDRQPNGNSCSPVHGTFIAGLVAAAADNGAGGAGVMWDGRVMPLKMAPDADCRLFDTTIAEAVDYAVDNGADIINASWTFTGTSLAMTRSFQAAEAADVLVVIAAGNDDRDVDPTEQYPIDYHLDTDLVVAATDNRDRRAGFSNWGATDVDIAAPGWRLWSTGISAADRHQEGSGTSFAAPLAAGVAALVWDAWPMLRATEVREALIEGSDVLPGLTCGSATKCIASGGRLSAPGALAEAERIATSPVLTLTNLVYGDTGEGDGDGDLSPERGETVKLRLEIRNTGHAPTGRVRATVAVDHPHARMVQDTIELDPIAAYATARPSDSPILEVPLACTTDDEAVITVVLQDLSTGEVWGGGDRLTLFCDIDDDGDGVRYPEDCDDLRSEVFPGAEEICNGRDDDCDGIVDGPDATGAVDFWPDADGDGFGTAGTPVRACEAPADHGEGDDDCDDTRADVHPGADEVCDGVDNDCDGAVDADDEDVLDAVTGHVDADGDGWGVGEPVATCAPDTVADRAGDCDDADAAGFPGSDSYDEACEPLRGLLGCTTTGTVPAGWLAGLGLLLLVRRRR